MRPGAWHKPGKCHIINLVPKHEQKHARPRCGWAEGWERGREGKSVAEGVIGGGLGIGSQQASAQ